MKKICAFLLAVSALSFGNAALAAHSDPGFYADLGAGYGKVDIEGFGVKNKGIHGTANLGYQFTPHLALEGGASLYRKTFNVQNYNGHVSVKGIIPLKDNIDLFAKVGAAYVSGISSMALKQHRIAPYLGAGVTYWVNDNIGTTLQAEGTTRRGQDVPGMYGASLGLTLKLN